MSAEEQEVAPEGAASPPAGAGTPDAAAGAAPPLAGADADAPDAAASADVLDAHEEADVLDARAETPRAAGGGAESDVLDAHAKTPRAAGGGAEAGDEAIAEADAEPAGEGLVEPLDEAALIERAGKADAYLDLAQRTQADFDNYRKRMTREVRAAEARGIGKLARELLPALDNLERALQAVEASDPEHHLSAGIRLVTSELSAALGRTGIQGYSPIGEPFDPSQHEAVAQQPFEGAEPGTVAAVLQSGYRLNEAILRPARVIVAS